MVMADLLPLSMLQLVQIMGHFGSVPNNLFSALGGGEEGEGWQLTDNPG